jgi:hypothetical protein
MLSASSVRFWVKDIFWIFTKQSDKPFSAYANRCAASFHACKADEKKLPNSSIFFGFYRWFDKMRTPRTWDPKSVSPDRLVPA